MLVCSRLGGCDGRPAAEFDDHLLAVVEGALVTQFLQRAGGVDQHAHPLARGGQEGGGQITARQHHGLCLLTLAWMSLTLLCETHTHYT